ncbi:MAG TPA: DEAD/DEAH box helicase, partial [Sphingomonas sp.]|nr:DEAD/DEAH box helicase [Sphingomonas sp.]
MPATKPSTKPLSSPAAIAVLTAPIATSPLGMGPLGLGDVVAALAETLADNDVIYAAADDAEAVLVARALAGFAPTATVLHCPASDALIGDDAPASPANVGQRVSALRRVRIALAQPDRAPIALITSGEAFGRAHPDPAAFDATSPRADVGADIDLAALYEELQAAGYLVDERVDEPGEVALRGHVLDVFPADADQPLRIEVAEGRIASLRYYDPADQRTTHECDGIELGRVAEPAPAKAAVTLLDHLPGAALIMAPGADDRRRRLLALAADAARRRPGRAAPEVVAEARWRRAVDACDQRTIEVLGEPPARFVEGRTPLKKLATAITAAIAAGDRVVLLGSVRDLRFLKPRLATRAVPEFRDVAAWAEVVDAPAGATLALAVPIDRGFRRDGILAIAAADLLGSRADRSDTGHGTVDSGLFDMGEVRVGDVVVHEDHGIGIVGGLEPMPALEGGEPGDAIKLVYADEGVRLVPVAEANRIWRYGADADAIALDKLDGASWIKRRAAIDAAIAESARGLTVLAAERAERTAPILQPDPAAYERFAAGFPYNETPDQARAIDAVRNDLAEGRAMERLVIGDVGYGKTEVALRAAAIAALAGHQAAIAAPTTVLARQHLEEFTERFAESGIVVAGLSRLTSTADRKKVRAGLADGSIQVVVGTGAIAAKGVAYRDLALVVVDEEQRFGAADKERLRALGAGHVLTLSATPIPRTLQTALVGLQQLSVIATPPA